MARTGRPKARVKLTAAERQVLERWARRAKSSQVLAMRSKIVLACAEGRDNIEIAAGLGVHRDTVSKWRNRFVRPRLGGVAHEQRPGPPPSIKLDRVEGGGGGPPGGTPGKTAPRGRGAVAGPRAAFGRPPMR